MTALRRLSQPIQAPSISLPDLARRLSSAVSATFSIGIFSKTPSSGAQSPKHQDSQSILERSGRSPNGKHRKWSGSSRQQVPSDQPTTPISITLRKASNLDSLSASPGDAQSEVSPTGLENQAGSIQINPPSVELVAFYSQHTEGDALPQEELGSHRLHMAASVIHEDCRIQMPQIPDSVHGRQQSGVADPAITVADVHVSPGTFITNNTSTRASPGRSEVLQRVSTIQFRSRRSVHEVIWREDETTSVSTSNSCGSHGSSSPERSEQFQIINPHSPDVDSTTSIPSPTTTGDALNAPFLDTENDSSSRQPRANLLQFSWDEPDVPPVLIRNQEVKGAPQTNHEYFYPGPNLSGMKKSTRPNSQHLEGEICLCRCSIPWLISKAIGSQVGLGMQQIPSAPLSRHSRTETIWERLTA